MVIVFSAIVVSLTHICYCLIVDLPLTNLGYISSYGSHCNPQLDPLIQFMALIAYLWIASL